MPNIANVLKEEITRLARKQARTEIQATRKASAQYRRDIALLKRQVEALTRKMTHLERQERRRTLKTRPTGAEGRRFSKSGLRSHRAKLGLSAADYAELVGVSAQTIYNWERGKSKPRPEQLAASLAIRPLGKRDARHRLEMLQS